MRFGTIILGAGAVVSTASATAISRDNNIERSAVFRWVGTNVAGAGFGEDVIPGKEVGYPWMNEERHTTGVKGKDYTWPNTTAITHLSYHGNLNTFRIPFLMERLAPDGMAKPFDEDYLSNLVRIADHILDEHCIPILDPHNFGRYNGETIDSPEDFKAFWKTLATIFKAKDKVVFDTNNEFHDMDQDLVFDLNQAAIDGIRSAGAEIHWIWAESNSYS